jgi:phospholipid/cholesterol/gamma-HCH transport system substrate-binding protein
MTRSRTLANGVILLAFVAFCVGVLEFLAINISQGNPLASNYTVHAVFADADGLPTAADVRVSGVDVGKVTDISHDPSQPGETVATLQITDTKAVPLYSDGSATVRAKTLLGEKYVDLTIGNSNTGETIADGGFLPPAQTGKDVSNDEIFNAFDTQTRAQQQEVIKALDAATFQRSGDIQAILPQLTTVISDLQPVATVYEKDQPQVDGIFVQLNTVMQTLADEHVQLASLLHNGNIATSAIAQKDQALIATLTQAASFSNEINNAMAPTVAAQRRAIQQLGPALQAQQSLLNLVLAPQPTCGNKPCGIDQLFTGTLLGNLNYPNNQLSISSHLGELVADEWDALFSQPNASTPEIPPYFADNNALSIDISIHTSPPP